jgi:hypothetical protein
MRCVPVVTRVSHANHRGPISGTEQKQRLVHFARGQKNFLRQVRDSEGAEKGLSEKDLSGKDLSAAGHGFNRAVNAAEAMRLQPLR